MAATVDSVKVYLGVGPSSPVNEEALAMAVAAANDYVAILRPDLTASEPWPPRVDQAANVQAGKLYGRRTSIQGVAAFADVGVTYLPRMDPEVRSLLELGEYQPSVVA